MNMRLHKALTTLAAGAFFFACNVYAQDSMGSATASPMSSSKKMMKAADRQTAHDVRRVLTRTKGLPAIDIRVFAKSGAITLVGTVPDSSQIELAGTAAAAAPNVKSVRNLLTVRIAGGH
ncbi:BON domain-containing protein [Burkholderia sp. L27(2015)]|uniref:BON domain-containing protein n=1 Tax=Burkholderia sp. L27(2015) TaxID=1641858 RepID=UPI0020B14800|nr:BON domain-containing protein [Burkholderia sp. L27(2015)]